MLFIAISLTFIIKLSAVEFVKHRHPMKLIYILFKINCFQIVNTKTQGLLALSFEFAILHNCHNSLSITEECYKLIVLTALLYNLAVYSSILNEYLNVFKINTATQLFHLVRLGKQQMWWICFDTTLCLWYGFYHAA